MFRASTIEKSFRASLIILLLSELTSTLGHLIDGIIISAFLGADGVKEFGIVNPMLIAYNALGSVFAVGSVTLCARLVGKGKTEDARKAFSVAFFWILALSVVITAALLILTDPIMSLLGVSPDTGTLYTESRNYFIGITISFPAINLMLFLTSYMQVDNDRNRALAATVVLTSADVAGDLLVAIVLKGDMLGMGLATSIANYLALFVLMLHFVKKDVLFKPSIKIRELLWKLTGTMLSNGSVACVTLLGNTFMFILLNHLLIETAAARIGSGTTTAYIGLIAFTAARNTYSLLTSVVKSMGRDVMTLASFFFGERNSSDLSELFRMSVKYTVLFAGGAAVVGIVLSGILAGLFSGGDVAAEPQAVYAIRAISLSIPFMSLNVAYECFFRGASRIKASLLLSLLRDFLVTVVAAYILSTFMGERGIYWSITAGQLFLTIGITVVILLRRLKNDKSFIERALFLPDSFSVPSERMLFRDITAISECTELSEAIHELCICQGTGNKRGFYAALCTEEICINILQHGFAGIKKSMISVRCLLDEDDIIRISIRDNCRPFSPLEWEALHSIDDDATKNIGIRLVSAISEEMRYVNILDMNSLYIKL